MIDKDSIITSIEFIAMVLGGLTLVAILRVTLQSDSQISATLLEPEGAVIGILKNAREYESAEGISLDFLYE
ncbi:MAG: hypothetical protein Q8Q18_02090 [bacterium]|nr:hypothetical protein [bacterium]